MIYVKGKKIKDIYVHGRALNKMYEKNKLVFQKYVTLSVISNVASYKVVIDSISSSDYVLEEHAVKVLPGTTLTIHIDAGSAYNKPSTTVTVNDDMTVTLNVSALYTITINPSPSSATVRMSTDSKTWSTVKSLTVVSGTTVYYEVSATNYTTQSSSVVATSTRTINVTLVLVNRTLTINPTPSNATVVLKRLDTNASVTAKSITVPHGTQVQYTVSATNYTTRTATVTVSSTQTINVTLTATTPKAYAYYWHPPLGVTAIWNVKDADYPVYSWGTPKVGDSLYMYRIDGSVDSMPNNPSQLSWATSLDQLNTALGYGTTYKNQFYMVQIRTVTNGDATDTKAVNYFTGAEQSGSVGTLTRQKSHDIY